MISVDENRKWVERARWCRRQADETERDLPPRGEGEAKSMAELSVEFWRGLADNIEEGMIA